MNRDDLTELHYITAIENLPSILKRGLLSHQRVSKILHRSVAMEEIQERRERKIIVSTGRFLHEYVNLYFHARNPMMYKRKHLHHELCVIRISTGVLDMPGAVIADQNASSGYVRFHPSPAGLAYLDTAMVFAEDWRHPGNPAAYWNHKAVKCAEVLVPDSVGAEYIIGACVSCEQSGRTLARLAPTLALTMNGHLFFQG